MNEVLTSPVAQDEPAILGIDTTKQEVWSLRRKVAEETLLRAMRTEARLEKRSNRLKLKALSALKDFEDAKKQTESVRRTLEEHYRAKK